VVAPDGSHTVSGTESQPITLFGQPPAGAVAAAALSAAQWADLGAAASAVGRALGARLIAAGAGDILGPLTAPRALTYGAAEARLD
jgi:hypothetical protein